MAVFDLLSGIVGAVVGALVVAIVLEIRTRGRDPRETWQLTTGWRIAELHDPTVVAHDLQGVEVPAGARVVASGVVDAAILQSTTVRQAPPVRAEFAIDGKGERALLFVGGARPGSLAFATVEPELVARLHAEARSLWDAADAYVERRAIADLVGRSGVTVETQGLVQAVLPYKDRYILRLEDHGHIIGVVVGKDPAELRDERVQVRGRLVKDHSGYSVIEATDLRRVR